MQTLIASSPRHANWRPNLRPPCAGFVDAGAITSVDYTAGGTLKELVKDLAQHGVALVFAHISESLKADLDRQDLTDAIGLSRQFETLRECLAAYASRTR